MAETETVPATAEHPHDWEPAGSCTHGFTGQIEYEAYLCAECGLGGHRRRGIFACARRREETAKRAARIARQEAACPVWDQLSERAKSNLRG